MRFIIFIFFVMIQKCFALDAVVTVLETPLLKNPSLNAPVEQYLRKGDVIKIHPALNKEGQGESSLSEFTDEQTNFSLDDQFIPTFDRQGNVVFVIKDHLYFYFNDSQELNQKTIHPDPTDYRLEEPLPPHYPLLGPSGYRGQATIGVTQNYTQNYPYPLPVESKSYSLPLEVNLILLRQNARDQFDRAYFGGTFNIKTHSNSLTLTNGIEAKERSVKLGFGPFASYDVFKGEENRISLYGQLTIYLFDQINISQSQGPIREERTYQTINVHPQIGLQYHRKKIFSQVDFILGSWLEFIPPSTYQTHSKVTQNQWWNNTFRDQFRTSSALTLGALLGFQVAY